MKYFSKKGLFYSLLGLLGFSGCENETPDMYGPMLMYGPMPTSLSFSTHVTDHSDQPIKGIRTIMEVSGENETTLVRDTVFTDQNGMAYNKISDTSSCYPDEQTKFTFTYDDVDGTENGLYESKTEEIAFKDLPTGDIITVKLKEIEKENEK